MRRLTMVTVLATILLGACSSDAVAPFGIVASSQNPSAVGIGEQRVMFGLVDQNTGEYLASPDHPATVTLRNEDGAPIETYPTEFMWTAEGVRGL